MKNMEKLGFFPKYSHIPVQVPVYICVSLDTGQLRQVKKNTVPWYLLTYVAFFTFVYPIFFLTKQSKAVENLLFRTTQRRRKPVIQNQAKRQKTGYSKPSKQAENRLF